MPADQKIPPLPSEQGGSTIGARWRWVVLSPPTPQSLEWARDYYRRWFGRDPDRCYEEWLGERQVFYMGWVTREEAVRWAKGGER